MTGEPAGREAPDDHPAEDSAPPRQPDVDARPSRGEEDHAERDSHGLDRHGLDVLAVLDQLLTGAVAHHGHFHDAGVAQHLAILPARLVHALELRVALLDPAAALETEIDQAAGAAVRLGVHRDAARRALGRIADPSVLPPPLVTHESPSASAGGISRRPAPRRGAQVCRRKIGRGKVARSATTATTVPRVRGPTRPVLSPDLSPRQVHGLMVSR